MKNLELVSLIQRICLYYQDHERLSESRLVHTVYLIDWRSIVQTGHAVSGIRWKSNYLGPWSEDVLIAVASRPDLFKLHKSKSLFGYDKRTIELLTTRSLVSFDPETESVLEFVLVNTVELEWGHFLVVVSLTYPISTQMFLGDPKLELDLVQLDERRREALAGDLEASHVG